LTVRCENICEAPQEQLKNICEFIEVDKFNYELYKDIPIQKDTNHKYRNILSEKEQKYYLDKAAGVRNIFGYLS